MNANQQHTELYELLGLTKDSTDEEIEEKYQNLSTEYHSDKTPEVADKFQEISFAYEVLSNPGKKEVYDRCGLKGLRSFDGDEVSEYSTSYFPPQKRDLRKLQPLVVQLRVSLDEIYAGNVTKSVSYKRTKNCIDCEGRGGSKDAVTNCSKCDGAGYTSTVFLGIDTIKSVCSSCSGRGTKVKENMCCHICNGDGQVEEEHTLNVTIDKGVPNEFQYSFPLEGDQQRKGALGDVVVVVVQEDHPLFLRRQHDLYLRDKHINLTEALCGFVHYFKHLDGRTLRISTEPGEVIEHDMVKQISGKGMPMYDHPDDYGDLLIKFQVDFPENNFATPKQLELLESVLPPREPFEMPADPEEVELIDVSPDEEELHGAYGGNAEDDDEDLDGMRFGAVECKTA